MSGEAIAIVAAAVGMLAVLVPLLLALAAGIRRELDHVRADMAEVRRDMHALAERVARIEGALTGPWRPPTNGPPTPESAATTTEANP